MNEHVGDWTIREAGPTHGDCAYTVSGWGLCWACKNIDDARAAAEMLNRLVDLCQDVWIKE